MTNQIQLGDILVDVAIKNIKHIHLSVHPPHGHVRISAPRHIPFDTLRLFSASKVDWIRKQQVKFRNQVREVPREFLNTESHLVWGKMVPLKIIETGGKPRVEQTQTELVLHVRPQSNRSTKGAVLENWYRNQLREAIPPLLLKWAPQLGGEVKRVFIQKMKTRWGSCNTRTRTIRLNTELAKKPPICLEYVLVHELAHFIERSHNARFKAIMSAHLPGWRQYRKDLNFPPLTQSNGEGKGEVFPSNEQHVPSSAPSGHLLPRGEGKAFFVIGDDRGPESLPI